MCEKKREGEECNQLQVVLIQSTRIWYVREERVHYLGKQYHARYLLSVI